MNRQNWKFVSSIVIIAALTLACSSLSLPGAGGSSYILNDDFSSSSSGWGTGTDSNSSVEYSSGGLQFRVFSEYYVTWSNPDQEFYSNIHIDVTAQNNSSDPLTMFGVICHEQASQAFYYLGVAGDGYYAIAKSEVDQDNVYLADGESSAIPTGSAPFTIGADCGGSGNLALYVNGQQIASAQDSSFTSGYVGLFAWSDENTNAADVTFDNFVMTALP
jgi:hypothetical protein